MFAHYLHAMPKVLTALENKELPCCPLDFGDAASVRCCREGFSQDGCVFLCAVLGFGRGPAATPLGVAEDSFQLLRDHRLYSPLARLFGGVARTFNSHKLVCTA